MSVVTTRELKNFETADKEGNAIVEKNKWFVVVLIQAVFLLIILFMYIGEASQNDKPAETRYMLMYPDGSWRVEFSPPSNQQEFYKTTIDKLLSDYVGYRFGKSPQTIRSDYAKATLFQGAQVKAYFVDENGFDAINKAGELSNNRNANTVKVNVLFFDHHDSVKGIFSGGSESKKIIKTNIYTEEIEIDRFGNSVGEPVRKIITMSWTLMSQKQLKKKENKFFLVNSLGLQILNERETIDRGAYTNNQ